MSDSQLRPTTHVLLAFAIVYVVWGSTYLVIRIGVHDAPAILFAGLRFLIAAGPMFVYAYWRGARLPKARRDWAVISITDLLMLVGANGLDNWSEQWVPSNQAALLVSTEPWWSAGLGKMGIRGRVLGGWVAYCFVMGV